MIVDKDAMRWLHDVRDDSLANGEKEDAQYFQRVIDMVNYYHDAYGRTLEELSDVLKLAVKALSK